MSPHVKKRVVHHHHFHVSADCPDAEALISAKIVELGCDPAEVLISQKLKSAKHIPLRK